MFIEHKQEAQDLKLPMNEVEQIKAKFANKVSVSRILKDSRGDLNEKSPTKKTSISLLLVKDLKSLMNRHLGNKKRRYDQKDEDSITI